MADKPETLAETQARLARVQQGGGTPGSPDLAQPGGAPPPGTAATRPDPYATSHLATAELAPPVLPPAPPVTRRTVSVVAIAFAAVALVAVAGFVASAALMADGPDFTAGDEPQYSEQWQEFPGISYVDPNDTLAQPSYEEVAAGLETLLTQYREELTAEFGFTWSQTYEGYSNVQANGYGGDSMLYYVDTGNWQGRVELDDPAARQTVFDLFSDLSAAHGGQGVLLRNEIYADDAEASRTQFGAAELEDQALWSFFNEFPSLAGGYLSGDVFDRNIPVDDGFTGDYMFTFDESSATLYVTIYGYADGLLKEGDRAAFEQALEPYDGDYTP